MLNRLSSITTFNNNFLIIWTKNIVFGFGIASLSIVGLHTVTEIAVRLRSIFFSKKKSLCYPVENFNNNNNNTPPRVLITGGLTGIGLELVVKFIRLGYDVEVWNLLSEDSKETTQKQFHDRVEKEQQRQKSKSKVSLRHVDVSDRKQVQAACQEYYSSSNKIPADLLILNAGIVARKALGEYSDGEVEKCFATNVTVHAFEMLNFFLPKMRKNNNNDNINWRRSIVIVSSVTSFSGFAYASEYCASKAALLSLGDSARSELSLKIVDKNCSSSSSSDIVDVDVDVLTVCPYIVATKMFDWCLNKTPFWFYSALDPKWVADKIVDEGIWLRRTCLVLPWFFNLMPVVKWITPHWCWEIADKIMDASNWLKP